MFTYSIYNIFVYVLQKRASMT